MTSYSRAIFILAKYVIDIIIHLLSKMKYLLAYPDSNSHYVQLFKLYWNINWSHVYNALTEGCVEENSRLLRDKPMVRHTAQKPENLNCGKIDEKKRDNWTYRNVCLFSRPNTLCWAYYRLCDERKLNLCVFPFFENTSVKARSRAQKSVLWTC